MPLPNVSEKRNKIDGTEFGTKTIVVDGRPYKVVEDDTNFGTTDTITEAIRPYKVYTALLSHNGTSAPTAVVLENTLGVVPSLSRIGVGEYKISATGLFLANKTFYFLLPSADGASADIVYGAFRINDNDILITVGTASEYTDNIITAHPIEIRVYN